MTLSDVELGVQVGIFFLWLLLVLVLVAGLAYEKFGNWMDHRISETFGEFRCVGCGNVMSCIDRRESFEACGRKCPRCSMNDSLQEDH